MASLPTADRRRQIRVVNGDEIEFLDEKSPRPSCRGTDRESLYAAEAFHKLLEVQGGGLPLAGRVAANGTAASAPPLAPHPSR
jgi:hypothetical protein